MGGMFSRQQNAAQGASQNASQYAPKPARRDAFTGAYKDGPPPAPTHKYTSKSQLGMAIKKYEDLIASGNPILSDDKYVFGFAPFNPDTDFNLLTAENTDPEILESRGVLSDDYTKKLVDRFNVIYPNVKHEWGGGARKRRRKTRKIRRKNNKK
jgi:hypothetical protein